eukprot:1759280-Prymnesium_polylepis.2
MPLPVACARCILTATDGQSSDANTYGAGLQRRLIAENARGQQSGDAGASRLVLLVGEEVSLLEGLDEFSGDHADTKEGGYAVVDTRRGRLLRRGVPLGGTVQRLHRVRDEDDVAHTPLE